LQSGDEVRENVARDYAARPIVVEGIRPYPAGQRVAAVIAAWLVPGAGHLVLGRFGRAAIFFITIIGAFALGLSLEGRLYWPMAADPPSSIGYDLISVLWTFAQIGTGLCYAVSYVFGFGTMPQPESPTFEYGHSFMVLAGLLNYLIIYDAFDIAAGRKR
jgi:hypothetical protein